MVKAVFRNRLRNFDRIISKRTAFQQTKFYSLPPRDSTINKFSFPTNSKTVKNIDNDLHKLLDKSELVVINGNLNGKPRNRVNASFVELRDENGDLANIILKNHVQDLIKKCRSEDAVSITGFVTKKDQSQWELVATNFQVLNSANIDAGRLDKLKHNCPNDIPPQFRYLQLRTLNYQKALKLRSKASNLIRNIFINDHDFTEIETPLLFKSTPEGAREFIVPTRKPDRFYALPQSPQQYKQLLMCSGFTKYFQFAKCFRDEDLRADRQPEFTQIDLEMSFINNSDQVGLVVEDLIHKVVEITDKKKVYKLNSSGYLEQSNSTTSNKLKFGKLKYIDALTKYGIDKPDLRSLLEFIDLSKYFKSVKNENKFPIVEICVLKSAFNPNEKFKINSSLVKSANYSKRKPYIISIKSESDTTQWYEKFVEKDVIQKVSDFNSTELHKDLNLKPGDIIAFSTRQELPYENPTPLGKFRQLAITEFPTKWRRPIVKPETNELCYDYNSDDVFVGSWVVDFPLFNPKEKANQTDKDYPIYDYEQFESTHHPFTMAKLEDYDLLASDPLKVRGEHYDLVINGVEVGGGSRRIHDASLQKYVFEEVLKIDNYEALFGHLLRALSMGCPPHAGMALGFDRLCAMLIGSNSIRDVIAFPKDGSGFDPVVECPTSIDENTLNQYNITVKKTNE